MTQIHHLHKGTEVKGHTGKYSQFIVKMGEGAAPHGVSLVPVLFQRPNQFQHGNIRGQIGFQGYVVDEHPLRFHHLAVDPVVIAGAIDRGLGAGQSAQRQGKGSLEQRGSVHTVLSAPSVEPLFVDFFSVADEPAFRRSQI